MKKLIGLVVSISLAACMSTTQVAENRNADFRDYNNYESNKFWRMIDIYRFRHTISKIQVAILAVGHTPEGINQRPYLQAVRDSLAAEIEQRNRQFRTLQKSYYDTSAAAQERLFETLKSDSIDHVFLDELSNSSYSELYQNLFKKQREAILASDFYRSRTDFENYLTTRSFSIASDSVISQIFHGSMVTKEKSSDLPFALLRNQNIDFLILYTRSFAADYSEYAGARISSETINLLCYFIPTEELISDTNLIYFSGTSDNSASD